MTKTYNVKGLLEAMKNLNQLYSYRDKELEYRARWKTDCEMIMEKYQPELEKARAELDNEQEKLNAIIADYEGRASARLLTAEAVAKTLIEIDNKLATFTTRGAAIGTTIKVDVNATRLPSSYRFPASSTQFKAKLTRAGWVITDIFRADCLAPCNRYVITFTPKTLDEMAEKLSRPQQ